MKKRRLFIKFILTCFLLGLAAVITCFGISFYIVKSTESKIVNETDGFEADCITVLGAKVRDGAPSLMLRDRLDRAIEIYFDTGIPLLMSGDCSSEEYDEVSVMRDYAISCGVPEEDIFTDPEGYSTLESITRLENFGFDSTIVVTQKYHLHRALYICKKASVDAVGAPAEDIRYYGEFYRSLREVAARSKDFLFTLFI